MQIGHYRRNRFFAALFVFSFMAVTSVHALNVSLWLNITEPLLGGDGQGLEDDSVIYVIGTLTDTPGEYGHPTPDASSIEAGALRPDEVIIATVRMDSIAQGRDQGEMLIAIEGIAFNTENVNFIYLRFFDHQGGIPPTGEDIAWGETAAVSYETNTFLNLALAEVAGVQADRTNTFVVIPEPGSVHLLAVAGLVVAAFCARREKNGNAGKNARAGPGSVDSV